jgi:glycosyltransferase involved in cell wall biosynthesis
VAADLSTRPRKLLFFVTEDYYFVSHRLPLAQAARVAGYDVVIVTRVREHGEIIRAAGLRVVPFENARSGLNPFREAATLLRLIAVYRRERPDIAHHVAMKPILYGTIAAACARVRLIVNAVAGLGWLFTSKAGLAAALKPLVRFCLRRVLHRGVALVQNPADRAVVAQLGVPEGQIRCIAGSGVDLDRFRPQPSPAGPAMVLFPARLLWDKGLGEFIAAARLLREQGVAARFVVAGEPDAMNPAAVPLGQVQGWVHEGLIDYRGFVADMAPLVAAAGVVCLPSYREGLPKSLIEAAAAGKAIVTTDVPGCRDVVRDGENGLLVPPRDPKALAVALRRVIEDAALRDALGAAGRRRAEREFGLTAIVEQTLAIYGEAS